MKTTAKHFEIFKAACEHYRQKLGLTDWEFRYGHRDHNDGDALAWVYCNVEGRVASVWLAVEWGDYDAPTKANLWHMARHEVLHVLMADVMQLASLQHGSAPATRGQAEHAIIRRLERVL